MGVIMIPTLQLATPLDRRPDLINPTTKFLVLSVAKEFKLETF